MRRVGKAAVLAKSVKSILTERKAVAHMEKGLIDALNTLLGKIGYKAIPSSTTGKRRGRKGRRRGRPPGRPAAASGLKAKRAGAKRGRPRGRQRGRPRKSA